MLRSPMTMSAWPESSGSTSLAMSVADVLIVGVGVDDDVGAGFQAGVDAGAERRREPLAAAEADDVMHAVRARDTGGVVARAVVDHEQSR